MWLNACGKRCHSGGRITATSSRTASITSIGSLPIVPRCKQQVEQRELDLAQDEHPRLEMPRLHHPLEQVGGELLAGLVVAGHAGQHVLVPGEILHQLARQLDRVPLEPVGAGDARPVHLGEEQVDAVPGLVQQRRHVVVRSAKTASRRHPARSCRRDTRPAPSRYCRRAAEAAPAPSTRRHACRYARGGRDRGPRTPSRSRPPRRRTAHRHDTATRRRARPA